jgi:hypothetical protein
VHATRAWPGNDRFAILGPVQLLGRKPLLDALMVQDREAAVTRPHLVAPPDHPDTDHAIVGVGVEQRDDLFGLVELKGL